MNAIYLKTQFLYIVLRICGVAVSMLASNGVDCGFEHISVQTKDCGIDIYCFSAKHTALRRKSKDWLARNQDVTLPSRLPSMCSPRIFYNI
jgi:hypothetical protein